jgi:hypothetical protein
MPSTDSNTAARTLSTMRAVIRVSNLRLVRSSSYATSMISYTLFPIEAISTLSYQRENPALALVR